LNFFGKRSSFENTLSVIRRAPGILKAMRRSIILALSAALLASSPVLGVQGGKHDRRRHERAIKGERGLATTAPKTIELTTGGAPVVVDDVRIGVGQERGVTNR
jgi:hypothetical protein